MPCGLVEIKISDHVCSGAIQRLDDWMLAVPNLVLRIAIRLTMVGGNLIALCTYKNLIEVEDVISNQFIAAIRRY